MDLALIGIGVNLFLIPAGFLMGASDVGALGVINVALCYFGYWANKKILMGSKDERE